MTEERAEDRYMHQPAEVQNNIIRCYAAETARHAHAYHQVVLPFQGKLEIEIENTAGQVKEGVGVFIAAGATHNFYAHGKNAFVVFDVPAPIGAHIEAADKPAFFRLGRDIQGLVDYVTLNWPQAGLPHDLHAAWSALLLERLKANGLITSQWNVKLRRATAFMRAQLARPITMAEIADIAGLSSSRLHAVFKEQFSTTPHAYLMDLRMKAAVELLSTTDLPIADVAARTGYTDQSALTRALRRARNQTPGALRRVFKNQRQ